MTDTFHESEGRSAFGASAAGYDAARPDYPQWMFERLLHHGALSADVSTLEIGPGNGLATRQLAKHGAAPIWLIEPDSGFAPYLDTITDARGRKAEILYSPFEDVTVSNQQFDLVVVATAYHWLAPETRIQRLAQLTRPGGYVALLWNVFQDLDLPDPFHEASRALLSSLASSPSGAPDTVPFALDRAARESEFVQSGDFDLVEYCESRWPLSLDAQGIRQLYGGFSSISRLPQTQRETLLTALANLVTDQFAGIVTRNMTSPLYLFKKALAAKKAD